MKTFLLSCLISWLSLLPLASFAWYVHVEGPSYTCPNSTLFYHYNSDNGGALDIEWTITNGLIYNEISQTWVTYWSYSTADYPNLDEAFPFKVLWGNLPIGTIANVHIRACDHELPFICYNGDRQVTYGSSPGTPVLAGSDYLVNCVSQQQSYTATSIPEGWSLDHWNYSAHIQHVTGFNPNTIEATSTSWNGAETLSGIFYFSTDGNTCGSKTVDKSIWLGTPAPGAQTVDGNPYYYGYELCPGNHWVGISWNGFISSTSWHVWTGGSYYTTDTQANFTVETNGSSSFQIQVLASNACGSSYWATWHLAKQLYDCGSFAAEAYPNPANTELIVLTTIEGDDASQYEVTADEVLLLDNADNTLIDVVPASPTTRLNTADILPGEYFLQAKFGKKVLRKHILIGK